MPTPPENLQQPVEREACVDRNHQGRIKIAALTGIRGYAASWVVLFHAGFLGGQHVGGYGLDTLLLIRSGYLGVDLFFILSGFVLFLTYSQTMRDFSVNSVWVFAIGRVFRIIPLHWFVVACFLVLSPFLGRYSPFSGGSGSSIQGFIANVLLVQTLFGLGSPWNPPSWSLSAEWIAYAAFPLLVIILTRFRSWGLCLTAIALGFFALALICTLSHQPGLNHTQRLGLLRCFVEFPAGMLLCKMNQLKPVSDKAATKMLIVGAACLAIACVDPRLDVLALPGFSLMILCSANNAALPNKIFGNRFANWLGEISFSIYMIHVLIIQLTLSLLPMQLKANNLVAALAGVCVLTVAVSWVIWKNIEIPAQMLGRILIRR